MTPSRQRVYEAIGHRRTDKVPKGEFVVDDELLSLLIGQVGPFTIGQKAQGLAMLGMDIACVELANESSLKELEEWVTTTDLLIFGIATGPFSIAQSHLGFTEFLVSFETQRKSALEALERCAVELIQIGYKARDKEMHGIIIADDIAFKDSTYICPELLAEFYFPILKQVVGQLKSIGLKVFFHSCGNLRLVLGDIVDLGVDGIHGLEPAAGMDITRVKEIYGSQVCIMGNLDPAVLVTGPVNRIQDEVRTLMEIAAPNGGYIFGTCSGYLGKGMPLANVLAAYRAAERYGKLTDQGLPAPY